MKVQIKDRGEGLKFAFINPLTGAPLRKVSQTLTHGAATEAEARRILIAGSYEEWLNPNRTIYYTSSDNAIVTPLNLDNVKSNTYSNGQGIIELELDLMELPVNSFNGCNTLTSITLPPCIKRIGVRSFYECAQLSELVIPASVTIIEREIFTAAGHIICEGRTPALIDGLPFNDAMPGFYIKVPVGTAATYKATTGWSSYIGSITE